MVVCSAGRIAAFYWPIYQRFNVTPSSMHLKKISFIAVNGAPHMRPISSPILVRLQLKLGRVIFAFLPELPPGLILISRPQMQIKQLCLRKQMRL